MDEILQFMRMFNIDKRELTKKIPVWRFDTLHVRGVDQMTSSDVYDYFGEIHPHTVEWLSNISCNVSFDSVSTAINAMIAVGRALVISKKNSNDSMMCEEDTLGLEVKMADTLEIPIPPNYRYILGCPSDKAKAIILRFAMINDVKAGDFAPKTRSTQKMDVDNSRSSNIPKANKIDNPLMFSNNIVLKMRADEEMEKIRRQKETLTKKQKNVWDRLGNLPVSNRISTSRPSVTSTDYRISKTKSSVFDRLDSSTRSSRSSSANGTSFRDSYKRHSVPSRIQTGRIQKRTSSHLWSAENRRNIESRLSRMDRDLVVYNEDEQNF